MNQMTYAGVVGRDEEAKGSQLTDSARSPTDAARKTAQEEQIRLRVPAASASSMPDATGMNLADKQIRQGRASTLDVVSSNAVVASSDQTQLFFRGPLDVLPGRKVSGSTAQNRDWNLALLESLKGMRAPPPQGRWPDPTFLYARLGKESKMTAVVVTRDKHIPHSLISERIANRLAKSKDGEEEQRQDDGWTLVDLSWPFDAAEPDARPNGSLDIFEAKQVRFLLVPKPDMDSGIVLAKEALKELNLHVTKGRHQAYLGVDGRREAGVLLHSFPEKKLNAAATNEPFRRLCRLAEFAATRRDKRKTTKAFRDQIKEEAVPSSEKGEETFNLTARESHDQR